MKYDELINRAQALFDAGGYEEAFDMAREAVARNRLHLRANYLYAAAADRVGDYLESYRQYSVLYSLQEVYRESIIRPEELLDRINQVISKCIPVMESLPDEERERYRQALLDVNAADKEYNKNYYTQIFDVENYFGRHYFGTEQYYAGRYNDWLHTYHRVNENRHSAGGKTEIYPVAAGGREITFTETGRYIVPVAFDESDRKEQRKKVQVHTERQSIEFMTNEVNTFHYFRMDTPARITADANMYYGHPILLKHHPGNKKLVCNIFLDSFNWSFVRKHTLEECMPFTARFFQKGVICDQFYAGSEFTYPSVASYWTGYRSTHHHMLNQNIHLPLPERFPVLPEFFRERGYMTSKIGGNTSVIPNYGYLRGMDRFVYERWEQNFHVSEAVDAAMEHLEAYGATDNFMWLEIQDLHDVAGYWKMPLSVETACPVEVNEIDNEGGSSLYQTHSDHRAMVYMRQLRHIDCYLENLYHYLQEHYAREDVIVTLLSDHGNGFNVENGQPFMSQQRINVPLMLYGGGLETACCDELIETIDYGHILCRLAGIKDERLQGNDGSLPCFFGGRQRKEYVFAQSLFPDRYYNAAIITEQYRFYFQSSEKVSNDCRISLKGMMYLEDTQGVPMEDAAIVQRCMGIIEEMLGDYLQ